MARKSIGEDPLGESEEIMQEFFKPSKGKSESRKSAKSSKEPKMENSELVKATFYLARKHIIALEEIRLKLIRQKSQRVDKSELVREAIELLQEHYKK